MRRHTFLIIEHQGQEYVFDAANPTKLEGGTLFSLFKPCNGFSSREADLKKDTLMIAAENIITHDRHYYGVNDGTYISEDRIAHGDLSTSFKDTAASSEVVRQNDYRGP